MSTPGPMNPLQIQLFTGAAAGRRARFDRSPISFGREPSNVLVVEDATVSRHHGEIRFESGMWVLVNKSENGTRVNRRQVTDKAAPLKSGDEIYVGGKLLFNVTIEPVDAPAAGDLPLAAEDAAAPLAAGAKKKNKLWMGIGLYMGAMLLLVILLSTLGKRKPAANDGVPELPETAIIEEIRQAPAAEPASAVRYREHLAEASRLFDRRNTSVGGIYKAYEEYRRALSYSGRNDGVFPADEVDAPLKYLKVQDELIAKVEEVYRDACNRLNRGDYEGAWRSFDLLKQVYGHSNSPLIQNAQAKQNIAATKHGKKIKPEKRR